MGLLARQFTVIHLVLYSKAKLNYSIIPKNLRKDERGSFQQLLMPTYARLRAGSWESRGRSEPSLPSGSSQAARDKPVPGRARRSGGDAGLGGRARAGTPARARSGQRAAGQVGCSTRALGSLELR